MIKTIFCLFNIINCCKKPKRNYCYVLELENKKWYIGRTSNLERRFKQHKSGFGSEWTKIHPVVQIESYIVSKNNFEEDMIVKKYMSNYGIENVRGGTYSTVKLTNSVINFLQKEILHANNLCFNCGELGHYVSNCSKKLKHNVNKIDVDYIVPFGKYKGQKLEELLKDLKYIEWMRSLYEPHTQIKIVLKKIENCYS